MGDRMLTVTGIKETVLRRLEAKGEVTIELISFTNLRTATLLNRGDKVFLTADLYEELSDRTEGIVADVEDISIHPVRVGMEHLDEKEVQRARLRVRFYRYGRIRRLNWEGEVPEIDITIIEQPLIL
jgi:hypothetical protein